jgi:MFS family permease
MLFGGVATDRISPRRILLATTTMRMILVAIIAVLVYLKLINLWYLYVLAFMFGAADAFALPAGQALLPMLVPASQLARANSLLGGTSQFASIAGPVPAAFLLRVWGVAAACAVDALSFLFAIAAIFRLRNIQPPPQPARQGIWRQLGEGLRYVAKDPPIRAFALLVAVSNFAAAGPLTIGLVIMARERFSSVSSLGTMMSALAFGSLLGTLLPALLRFQPRRGLLILTFSTTLGLEFIALAFLHSLPAAAAILGLLGFGNGLLGIYIQSWFQGRIEPALMGRVMSVFMFAAFGLAPFSSAAAGFLAQLSLTVMFLAAGALVLLLTAVAAFTREVREIR